MILDMKRIILLTAFLLITTSIFAYDPFLFTPENGNYFEAFDIKGKEIKTIEKTKNEIEIEKAISQDYCFNWVEEYVKEDCRYSFTKINDNLLTNLLPIKKYYLLSEKQDTIETTVTVKIENKQYLNFIIDNDSNKIIALSLIE